MAGGTAPSLQTETTRLRFACRTIDAISKNRTADGRAKQITHLCVVGGPYYNNKGLISVTVWVCGGHPVSLLVFIGATSYWKFFILTQSQGCALGMVPFH